VLAEARVRLVAGLKRYFHDKRGQGLLSGRGMLVLDHACDVAMDGSSSPLVMWSSLERCAVWAQNACLLWIIISIGLLTSNRSGVHRVIPTCTRSLRAKMGSVYLAALLERSVCAR